MPIALTSTGVVADPATPVVAPGDPGGRFLGVHRTGIAGMTWTGRDGLTWDLTRSSSGVLLLDGATGFMPEAWSAWTTQTAGHGQAYRGGRFEARPVLWPLLLWHDGTSTEFVERARTWWSGFSYDPHSLADYGRWEVAAPDGTKRVARLRLEDAGDQPDHDPTARGWTLYSTKLVMDSPFWEGQTVTRGWGPASSGSGDFLKPTAGVIRISSGFTVDQATATNSGDVEAWPVWTLRGPWNSATLGVNGRVIGVPFTGTASDVLVIDTRAQTATLNGVDASPRLSSWEWAPVPPGGSVPLDITLNGNGTVSLDLTPLYFRAFG